MTHTKHLCMQLKDGVLQFQPTPDGHGLSQQSQLAAKRAECGFCRHPSYDRQRTSVSTRSGEGFTANRNLFWVNMVFRRRGLWDALCEEICDKSILPGIIHMPIMMYRPLLHPWCESANNTIDRESVLRQAEPRNGHLRGFGRPEMASSWTSWQRVSWGDEIDDRWRRQRNMPGAPDSDGLHPLGHHPGGHLEEVVPRPTLDCGVVKGLGGLEVRGVRVIVLHSWRGGTLEFGYMPRSRS